MKSVFRVTLLSLLVSACFCVTQGPPSPPPPPPSPPPVPETAMKCECTCTQAGKPQNLYRASGNFVGSVEPVTTSVKSEPSTVTKVDVSSDVNSTTTKLQNEAGNKTTGIAPQNTTSSATSVKPPPTTSKTTTAQPTIKTTQALREPRIRFVDVASDQVVRLSLSSGKKNINSNEKSENVTKTTYTVSNGLSTSKIQKLTPTAIFKSKAILTNRKNNVFSFTKKAIPANEQKLSVNRTGSKFKLPKLVKNVVVEQTTPAKNESTKDVKSPMPKYRLPNDERFNAPSQSKLDTTTEAFQDVVVMSNWRLGHSGGMPLRVLSGVRRSEFKKNFKDQGVIIESIEKLRKGNIMPQKRENVLNPKETSKFVEQNSKNTGSQFIEQNSKITASIIPTKQETTTGIVIPDPPKQQQWSSSTTSANQWQQVSSTPGTWSFGGNWNEGNMNPPGQMWRGGTSTPVVPGNNPSSFKTGGNPWMGGSVRQNMQNKNTNQGVTIPTTEPMPPSMTMSAMEQMGGQAGMEVQAQEMPQYNMQGMHFPMGEFQMNPYFYNQQMKR